LLKWQGFDARSQYKKFSLSRVTSSQYLSPAVTAAVDGLLKRAEFPFSSSSWWRCVLSTMSSRSRSSDSSFWFCPNV